MIPVRIGDQNFEGPGGWDEVTRKQYLQWARWGQAGSETVGLFVLLRQWYRIRIRALRVLDDEQRTWLLDEVFAWLHLRPSRWLLPRLRVGLRRYRGPGDRLQYLTFGEYMHAEAARQQIEEGPTRDQLIELAAALYRPYSRGGEGERATFVPAQLDKQIRRFRRVPDAVLHGVYQNFLGCLDPLPERFSHLYAGGSEQGDGSGTWLDVGLSLARQTGALGNFHELERTNVYLVLTVLNDVMREAAELKKKLDSHG